MYFVMSFAPKPIVAKKCDQVFVSKLRFLFLVTQCFVHALSRFLPTYVSDLRFPKESAQTHPALYYI
jgi:hypothetical protein